MTWMENALSDKSSQNEADSESERDDGVSLTLRSKEDILDENTSSPAFEIIKTTPSDD